MKSKFPIRFSVALQLVSLLCCSSCLVDEIVADMFGGGPGYDKEWAVIPKGRVTTVTGQFRDYARDSSIANLTVYVDEYIDHPLHDLTFSMHLDSTVTDQYGNFEMSLTTTGVGVQYQLSYTLPEGNWSQSFNPLIITRMGTNNIIDVVMTKLTRLEARIKVVDNLHPPLSAGTNFGSIYQFNKANQDSVISLNVIPNTLNYLLFTIRIDTATASGFYFRERIDTIDLIGNFSDTVKAAFELHPNQFKRRN